MSMMDKLVCVPRAKITNGNSFNIDGKGNRKSME